MSLRSEVIRIIQEYFSSSKKITELPDLPSNVANGDLFEVVRSGTNYKGLGSQLPSGGGGSQDLASVIANGGIATGLVDSVSIQTAGDINFEANSVTLISTSGTVQVSGNINMGGSKIVSLGAATTNGDAVRYEQIIGVQDLFISAAGMWPRTTGGCAELAKTEIATSLFNIQSLDFDQTSQEFCQFQIVLPRKWNMGTVTAVFYWTAAAGSGTVQFGISGGAYSNDDALTVALGTPVTADDTLLATNDLHISTATSAMTLAGTPASADFLAFQVSRNPGSDTLNADAKLLGVSIRITTTAAIDA